MRACVLLAAALLPSTASLRMRGVLPSPMAARARSALVIATEPSLSEEQNYALMTAAKSSKYYNPLNRPGGASSETWTAVRVEYPELQGLSDDALGSAFAVIKRVGAGNRTPEEEESGSAFDALAMPQKVALVRAVRGGAYDAAIQAASGVSDSAWATIIKDSPDLAGLSVDTLETAMAELLSPDGGGDGVASSAPPLSSVAFPLALVAFIYLSVAFNSGPSSEDARISRANTMVQENVSRWAAKNMPAN